MFLRTLIAVEPGEPAQRVSSTLDHVGVIARSANSLDELRQRLAAEPFDLVILDRAWARSLTSPLIGELRELPESPEVIVLLEDEDAELRARLLAAGAYAVLYRELPEELFRQALVALAERRLGESQARLRCVPDEDYRLGDYATRSPAMQAVLRSARRIAERDTTALLLGETELLYLRGLLEEARGRIGETASRAGMDPRSLHQKMKKYDLRKEDYR